MTESDLELKTSMATPISSYNLSGLRMFCALLPSALFGVYMNLAPAGTFHLHWTVLALLVAIGCGAVNIVTSHRATDAWYYQRKQQKALDTLIDDHRRLKAELDEAKGQSIQQLIKQARQVAAHRVDDPSTWVVQLGDVQAPPGFRVGDTPYLELCEQYEGAKHALERAEFQEITTRDRHAREIADKDEINRLLKVENQMLRDRVRPGDKILRRKRPVASA